MKVVLLNENPAVSRLVKLSLSRLGHELNEVATLDEVGMNVDLLICDSALLDENIDYNGYATHVLYLLPRNYENKEGKRNILEKPFLPTDFINLVNSVLSVDKVSDLTTENLDANSHKTASLDVNSQAPNDDFQDDFSDIKEESNDDFADIEEEPQIQESSDDFMQGAESKNLDVNSDLSELNDENSEFIDKSAKEEELTQLSDMVSEIDNFNEEELKDAGSNDDESTEIELDEMPSEIKIDGLDELDLKQDEQNADISELPSDLEENPELDEIQEELQIQKNPEIAESNEATELEIADEVVTQSETEIGKPQDVEQEDELETTQQETDENTSESEITEQIQSEFASEPENAELDEMENISGSDIATQSEIGSEIVKPQEDQERSEISVNNDFDTLSESDILSTFGEVSEFANEQVAQNSMLESTEECDSCDDEALKDELSREITEQITQKLSSGALKDALKNMNIKISVSFEEKK